MKYRWKTVSAKAGVPATHTKKKPGKSVPLIDLEPAEILPSVVAGMKGNGSTSQQEVLQNKAGSQHLQFHLPSRQFGTAFIQSLGHIAPGQSSVQLLTPLSRNTCVSASSFSHLIEHPVTLYGSLLHSDRYLIAMFWENGGLLVCYSSNFSMCLSVDLPPLEMSCAYIFNTCGVLNLFLCSLHILLLWQM